MRGTAERLRELLITDFEVAMRIIQLRLLLEYYHLKPRDVAPVAGFSYQYVYKILAGDFKDRETALTVCDKVDAAVDELR